MFGYETAQEEILARIDTLRSRAANARKEAQSLSEQGLAAEKSSEYLDRLASEYESLLSD